MWVIAWHNETSFYSNGEWVPNVDRAHRFASWQTANSVAKMLGPWVKLLFT